MVKNTLKFNQKHSKVAFKLILLTFAITLFLVISVSAILETTTPIDITKDQPIIFAGKEVAYNNLWEEYAPIRIDTWLDIPLISKTTAEMYIDKHTETCGQDCSSNIIIDLKEDGILIDDVRFYTIDGEKKFEQPIRSYQFYIKTGEEEYLVNDYTWTCALTGKININGTEETFCENKLTGTHIEKKPLWETYQMGTEVKAGVYEIKLDGEKRPDRNVDWQIKTNGIWTTDWATWSFGYMNLTYDEINDSSIDGAKWTNSGASEGTDYVEIYRANTAGEQGLEYIVSNALNRSYVQILYVSTYLKAVDMNAGGCGLTGWTNFSVFGVLIQEIVKSDGGGTSTTDDQTNWTFIKNETSSNYSIYNDGVYVNQITPVNNEIKENVYTNGEGPALQFTGRIYYVRYYGTDGSSYVVLNSPSNNYISPSNSVDFNCSATSTESVTLTNISLWTNSTGSWSLNKTNTSVNGLTSGSSTFSLSLPENYSKWTCQGCDNDGDCGFASENRTILIDTFYPSINIIHPSTIENIGYYNINQNISWAINDTNLQSIWYNYNGTNISISGAINSTTFKLDGSDRNLTIYANDSAGNENNQGINWTYKVFVLNETYTTPTSSGIINNFLLQLLTNGTQTTIGYLNYNNTDVLGSISSSGNYYNVTRSQIAIGVSNPTNISFYWNVTMGDGYNFTMIPKNQTVNPIVINSTCGTKMYVIYNFTMADEITKIKLNATPEDTLIKTDLNLYTSDRTLKLNQFYQQFNKTNPVTICIDNNLSGGEQYSVNIQVQYSAANYSSEFYNIERYVLNSSTLYNNITLYDLDNTNTQKFKLIARDTSYLPIDSALIQIERKYIENGTFYISEIPRTDGKGITSASLQLNDVIYNFYIYQAGVLISSFTNVLAICQTPIVSECTIDFNAFQTGITIPDYEEGDDFNFTLDYNDTSKVITSQFVIPSGEPATIKLEVTREDSLGTAVCDDTKTSASGTLSCIVPSSFGNSTVMAKLYKNNVEQGKGNIKLDQKPSDIFGVVLIMMSVLVMMTLIGVGISDSPVITGVFIFVGLILLFSMNLVENTGFIGATATILFFAIAVILVIIKAARRS